jgi:hypothetical protein
MKTRDTMALTLYAVLTSTPDRQWSATRPCGKDPQYPLDTGSMGSTHSLKVLKTAESLPLQILQQSSTHPDTKNGP